MGKVFFMNENLPKQRNKSSLILKLSYGIWFLSLVILASWLVYTRADADETMLELASYKVEFPEELLKKEPAEPAPPPLIRHEISLILTGVGINTTLTLEALEKLSPSIAFAVSPYTDNLKTILDKAKEQNRIILIDIPLKDPSNQFDDPGPLALDPSGEVQELLDSLRKMFPTALGLYGNLNHDLDPSNEHLSKILSEAKLGWAGTLGDANEKIFKAQTIPYIAQENKLQRTAPFKSTLAHLNDYAEDKDEKRPFALNLKPDTIEGLVAWLAVAPIILKPLEFPKPQPEAPTSHDPKP